MKPPTFGARLAKASTRIATLPDPNQTEPLSCFSLDPQCEELVPELARVREAEPSVIVSEDLESPLAAPPQPDGALVERPRR